MDRFRHDDPAVPPRDGQRHQHRLGRGRAAVVEAGVGDVHAGQLGDQRLVFERRLERPLAGLGLVRGVRRVELAPGGEVVDHRGDEVVVASAAQEADPPVGARVPPDHLLDSPRELQLGEGRRDAERTLEAVLRAG